MPDPVLHNIFGNRVKNELKSDISDKINSDIFDIALNGPDDWEMYRFFLPSLKRGINTRHKYMHTHKTGEFLFELLNQAKNSSNVDNMFSYWAGFICHYEMDSYVHPYICSKTELADYNITNSGNHMAFEHELDKRVLKKLNISLFSHPISSIYKNKSLPVDIKYDIDAVYKKVFEWDNAWHDLNIAHRDTAFFKRIIEDPTGLLYHISKLLFKKKPHLMALSYYKTKYQNDDVLNSKKSNWINPFKIDETNALSVEELIENAKHEALNIIILGYQYLYEGKDINSVNDKIGNKSYSTGCNITD